MANRQADFIETGRAQLFVDVTVHERPGEGNVELTGGASGSVDSILVGGVTELLGAAVPFNTDLDTTAEDTARAINNRVTVPNYHARAVGAKVYVWQQTIVAGAVTLVSATTTITTTDTNIDNGAAGNGTPLGYTEEGFTLSYNDEYLKEPAEESGKRNIKSYYLGENPTIEAVFKQWDSDVLALRMPGRHVTTGDVNRIEIPGTLTPGDDLESFFKVFELRPDNRKYAALLIRKGQAFGNAGEPTRFRTQEVKKVGVTLDCFEDANHAATDYRTLGIDLAQNLTL